MDLAKMLNDEPTKGIARIEELARRPSQTPVQRSPTGMQDILNNTTNSTQPSGSPQKTSRSLSITTKVENLPLSASPPDSRSRLPPSVLPKRESVASIPTPAPSFPSDSDSASLKHETPPPLERHPNPTIPSLRGSPHTQTSTMPAKSLKRRRVEDEDSGPSHARPLPTKASPSLKHIPLPDKPVEQPPQPPARKPRKRDEPVPIYARSARVLAADPDAYLASRQHRPVPRIQGQSTQAMTGSKRDPVNKDTAKKKQINGNTSAANSIHPPMVAPPLADALVGGLPLLEPSIVNTTPFEEVTRMIADFLFENVVMEQSIGVAATGEAATGAVFEIEAKLGQIIDQRTNDRLSLPVMTETILSHADPNIRTKFQSSMTERQHKFLNDFLNKALLASQPPRAGASLPAGPPRKRIDYVHTRERDTFYELNQAAALQLPSAIRNLTTGTRGHLKPRLRVTTEAKTGRELAKIVKARFKDIEVFSPKTPFDWRVSINVEMQFQGDTTAIGAERVHGEKERNKDRVSYRHQDLFQVDLTQVTVPETGAEGDKKEHELEVEVSSAEIRKQGQMAMGGEGNRYEEVVKAFVDNVRVLARSCK